MTMARSGLLLALLMAAQGRDAFEGTIILGRPTGHSITASVMAADGGEGFVEYGVKPEAYTAKTAVIALPTHTPVEIALDRLRPATRYYYRLRYRRAGAAEFGAGAAHSFSTAPGPGTTFVFGVQGDSHPERLNRMFVPELYARTLENASRERPDFYVLMGDDFNVDQLYNRGEVNSETMGRLYANQRRHLGPMAASTPLFLVNGNHEQGAAHLLDGTPTSVAVLAGLARNRYFPNPAPDGFYSGDLDRVEHVGLLRDYYAFTWGDALFVTLDPYWHSPVQVDSGIGGARNAEKKGGQRQRDMWGITLGRAQYEWFKRTLEQSKAKYKFVFSHHVLGTGRGGVEMAGLYEWGGYNRNGEWEFGKRRPGWEMPIHPLMAKHGVSVFFQGHDHLFARQQKDSVVYQECPNPADHTYTAFNRDAYQSGDILPNSGYLRVTVSAEAARVDYIRSYLPGDEKPGQTNGQVAFSYTVRPWNGKR